MISLVMQLIIVLSIILLPIILAIAAKLGKNTQIFQIFFFIVIIFFSFIFPVLEELDIETDRTYGIFDYARITDLEYRAVVVDTPGSSGKIVITERITFDIHAASKYNLFWELWRDLPEEYVDGVKVSYKVNSVKQIFPDRPAIHFQEAPTLYWWDNDYVNTARRSWPRKVVP